MIKPTFVVAGAARAGSTAVIETLRRHPRVFITTPKEPHYLALGEHSVAFTGPGDDQTINAVRIRSREEYLGLYPKRGDYLALGEGSVSTLYYPSQSISAMNDINPEIRVVIVLREPVSRAYSSHQYLLNRGHEPQANFLTAVDLESARIAAGWHHLWHYTSMSLYAKPVAALLKAFGDDRVRVWWYDDLLNHAPRCLGEIHRFIGVDLTGPIEYVKRVNASGQPRRAWVQEVLHAAERNPQVKALARATVPFSVRERIRNSNLSRVEVPEAAATALHSRFAEDISRLEDILRLHVPAVWRSPPRH